MSENALKEKRKSKGIVRRNVRGFSGDISVETKKGKDLHKFFFTNPQQVVANPVANGNDGPIKDEDGYGIQSVLHRHRC